MARIERIVGVLKDHLKRGELFARAPLNGLHAQVVVVELDGALGRGLKSHDDFGER